MEIILKNTTVTLQRSLYEKPVKVLANSYVTPAPRISTSTEYEILIYQVKAGCTYELSTPENWISHGVDLDISILNSPDCTITNAGTVEDFAQYLVQHVTMWQHSQVSADVTFIANSDGYLYVSRSKSNGTWQLELKS